MRMNPKEGYLGEFCPYRFVYAELTWSPVGIGPFMVSGQSSWSRIVLGLRYVAAEVLYAVARRSPALIFSLSPTLMMKRYRSELCPCFYGIRTQGSCFSSFHLPGRKVEDSAAENALVCRLSASTCGDSDSWRRRRRRGRLTAAAAEESLIHCHW
jgi:hypothetical protein